MLSYFVYLIVSLSTTDESPVIGWINFDGTGESLDCSKNTNVNKKIIAKNYWKIIENFQSIIKKNLRWKTELSIHKG